MPIKTQQLPNNLGLEATERIIWQGWQPGGEYTKNITLKNVDVKAKKLKYKIPSSRFFTTKYPQPIILSSGTSMSLPITFRPLEKSIYEDRIVFETKEGKFSIPMTAVLPEADLVLPEILDFGFCAVSDQIQKNVDVFNYSDLEISFKLHCAQPFEMKPPKGYIQPNSRATIAVNFKPEGAYVYQCDASCQFGADNGKVHTKTISLQGTGKYAYLGAKFGKQLGHDINIDFKNVAVNSTSEKVIELINQTAVNAPFQVIQPSLDASVDKAFQCSQYHGIVPAKSSVNLRISYTPSIKDVPQADFFQILALGATSCATIKCVGQGRGPNVCLDSSSVSFGLTEIGTEVTRAFQIKNRSQVDAIFQLQIDNEFSVFHVDTKCGKLKAGSSQTVKVTFIPEKPISYYRRLICLLHNQDPLYLDLFGTCHTDQITPGVLQRKHIERYRVHSARGLSRISPEDLRTWLQEDRIFVGEDGCLNVKDEFLNDELMISKTEDGPMEEFFNDGTIGELTTTVPHVSLDVRSVDFSRCALGQVYHKTMNVTNHTQGKVSCVWNSGKKGSPFSVQPSELDILPLQSVSFSVKFKPTVAGQFFSAELEGYVFYKSTRDHRLVEDITMCPPWCITAITTGHTFPLKSETFLPQCELDSKTMVFSPVTKIQPSYKTLLLSNHGKNPIDFAFDEDDSRTFSCKPSRGLLQDKFQIIVFRYLPDGFGVSNEKLKCRINASDKYTKDVDLTGSAEVPDLQIQAKDAVYFQPTYVGTTSDAKVSIKNPCRMPLRFQWKIMVADKDKLSVYPMSGMISSNEVQTHNWTFKPSKEGKQLFKVKLTAYNETESIALRSIVLRLVGEGQMGSLSCNPDELDLGNVVVGNTVERTVNLQNESDCGLHYDLQVDEVVMGFFSDENAEKQHRVLELVESKGFLPARSRKAVELKVQPRKRCKYICKILCQLVSLKDDESLSESSSGTGDRTCLCTVTIKGVFPTLAINDVRGLGCVQGYSRKRLWGLLSVDRFNSCLDADPGSQELLYKVPTRHSTRRRMPVHTRAVLDFNFGSAPHLSESCQILINLQNTGSASVEWNFLFPTDLQLDMEFWAQTGEFDEDELHEMFVLDHSLFSIHPKKGMLTPGESQVVSLSYSHSAVGIHRLPVLFKVSRGREILLNFIGNTVSPDDRYLHFSTTRHMFETVPIGRITPPIQMFPLHNGGGQPVEFHLDISPLDEIQEKNCGWRIFECLNPTGIIPPGETIYVSWIFSPLEAKTYSVDVMIHTVGGESTFVTFTGIGYDQALMGPTMDFAANTDDTLPKKQLIPVAEQLMYLSEERLSFDNVPLLSEARRVIFLRNVSTKFAISFRWMLDKSPAYEVLSIEPSQGYIEPSEFAICKVIFCSKGPPAIYDLDCVCEVVNETLMAKYNKSLLDWHKRQEEKKLHFTIRESDINPSKNRPGSGPTKLKSIDQGHKLNRSESDLRKYDALPPIKADVSLSNNDASFDDPHPTPPDAFIIHMGITARTHSIEEFRSKYIDFANQFAIHSASESSNKIDIERKPRKMKCCKEEYETIASILPLIIMDLLEDKDFEVAIKMIRDEPVPYFGMLMGENPTEVIPGNGVDADFIEKEIDNTTGANESIAKSEERMESSDQLNQAEPNGPVNEENSDTAGENLENDHDSLYDQEELTDTVNSSENQVQPSPGVPEKADQEMKTQDTDPILHERQMWKGSEEFTKLLDDVFENTLFNLITEASRGEINLTARPRLIALPPSAKGSRKT